jgi:Fic family protein
MVNDRERLEDQLRSIDHKKSKLDTYRPLAANTLLSLREKLAMDWTYHSNAIEGNTLTLRETKIVIEEGITIGKKSLKEHFEAINHHQAISFIEALANKNESISLWTIKNIHQLVLKNITDEYAGVYRKENVVITGASFIPPSHFLLDEVMTDLIQWHDSEAMTLHPIEKAAQLHTRFVKIHPFIDGNGRTARLLMNLSLIKDGYPIAIIQKEDRLSYFDHLDHACVTGDFEPFTSMVADCVDRTFDLYNQLLDFYDKNE